MPNSAERTMPNNYESDMFAENFHSLRDIRIDRIIRNTSIVFVCVAVEREQAGWSFNRKDSHSGS